MHKHTEYKIYMGSQVSLVPKVSYEDIQMVVYRNRNNVYSALLLNTLPEKMQNCLIQTTVDFREEEHLVNDCIINNPNIMIIVYGKNSNDITILDKYEQLTKLGFPNVYIYTGGLFEWLLLHDIYGKDLFKITKYEIDILKYRPRSVILQSMAQGYNFGSEPGYLGGGSISGNIPFIENNGNGNGNGYAPDIAINIPNHKIMNQRKRGAGSDSESDSNSNSNSDSDSESESWSSKNKKKREKTSEFSIMKWLFK